MDLEQVKKFLEENQDQEDVKSYIEGLSEVTPDRVETFLESDEGKKLLQPKLDKYFSKGLETWKEKNLQKLVNDELNKKNPEETPEQKRIRELEQQFETMSKEKTREALKNKALTILNDKKLPSNLVDVLVSNDEETTLSNLEQFEEVFTTQLQNAVESKLKSDGTTISKGSKPTTFTLEQIQSMSQEEINENWDAVQESMKNN
ncbi:DUF4355 domain-containing protein [Gracilibacillus caseinilyticus]|uniref:DUF4355 domain-containing protein n=1 Tax=Gracilibacillus caseinilyticus TaxID=2932256 RepID=A0ABY4EUK2_9BACI|nr:DUF4355 domain-containing protein [Gracilibacillus caseinilyticus]UOQ47746.1 DUF4355 domain-containing protein [Gracilibacillus caseinilyticus]